MLSGISSLLFRSSVEPTHSQQEEILLTTVADDNEWLLVDLAETVPVPIELCPLVDHLEDSIHESDLASNEHVVERYSHTGAPRYRGAYVHAIASGRGVNSAPWRYIPQPRGAARKSFERSNRVHEHVNQIKRQHRYSYKLCNSVKQQRTF